MRGTQEQPLRADAVLTKSQENFEESVLGRRQPLWSFQSTYLWGALLSPLPLLETAGASLSEYNGFIY